MAACLAPACCCIDGSWLSGLCAPRPAPAPRRAQFSKWWVSEWKNVQFPEKGLVFDYFVDEQQCLMVPWDERVPKFTYSPDNFTNMCAPRPTCPPLACRWSCAQRGSLPDA